MNWFVSGVTNHKITEDDNYCKHLKIGAVARRYTAECDPWGRETYYMCESCWEALQEEIRNEEVVCSDCHGTFLRKDVTEWRPWDFSAAEGDTPFIICNNCSSLPPHLNRVEYDREMCRRECGDDYES